eukprot:gene6167-4428_t
MSIAPADPDNAVAYSHWETLNNLSKAQQLALIRKWLDVPTPSEPSLLIPMGFLAPGYGPTKIRAGNSNINNSSGGQSPPPPPPPAGNDESSSKALIDGYLNLLVNFGVIGALIFSTMFGFTITDFDLSTTSKLFFGRSVTLGLKYMFLLLVNLSVMLSMFLILSSLQLYKYLGFFMPNEEAQLEWTRTTPITSSVIQTNLVVYVTIVAIPFGAASAISPIAGLISTVCLLLMLVAVRWIMFVEERTELLLKKYAMRILRHGPGYEPRSGSGGREP